MHICIYVSCYKSIINMMFISQLFGRTDIVALINKLQTRTYISNKSICMILYLTKIFTGTVQKN